MTKQIKCFLLVFRQNRLFFDNIFEQSLWKCVLHVYLLVKKNDRFDLANILCAGMPVKSHSQWTLICNAFWSLCQLHPLIVACLPNWFAQREVVFATIIIIYPLYWWFYQQIPFQWSRWSCTISGYANPKRSELWLNYYNWAQNVKKYTSCVRWCDKNSPVHIIGS